ncbi:MAG: hypothetical protein ACE5F9_03015 [Phycisphaerae bacterium]
MSPQTMDVEDTPTEAPVERGPPPSWPAVLLAPWIGIFHPTQAASTLAAARRRVFWACYGVGAAALAAVILVLAMWDASIARDWSTSGPAVAHRSFLEVWARWHRYGVIGPVEWILLSVLVLLPAVMAIGAWLFLPTVHRGGSVRASFARSFRAMTAGLGLFDLLVLIFYGSGVALSNVDTYGRLADVIDGLFFIYLIAILASLCVFLLWLTWAAAASAGEACSAAPHPCCEGCGYDLTHRPANGRCPECGLAIDASLTPDLRRPGAAWETRPAALAWLRTSFAVIRSPARFYGRLKVRTPSELSRRFAGFHLLAIGLVAALWTVLLLLGQVEDIGILCGVPFLVGLGIPLVAWSVHRLVAAVAVSWWITVGALPDSAQVAKVVHYEAAWLWVLCLCDGVLVSTFVQYEDWMSNLLGRWVGVGFLRMPPEPAAFLFGSAAICLYWLRRYHLAANAVRWSNF